MMNGFSDSIIYNIFVLTVIIFICFYFYFTSTFDYWKDRSIPYVRPLPFFGNMKDQFFLSKNLCDIYQEIYDKLKGCQFGGIFLGRTPAIMIKDPELVANILVRDFNHFYNRGFFNNGKLESLNANLFDLEGEPWRNLRYKLTPTFSSGKLKIMFDQICNCGEELIHHIDKQSKDGADIKSNSLLSSFALDVIATCAFGLQTNTDSEESIKFRKMVTKILNPSKRQMFRIIFLLYAPKVAKKLQLRLFPKELEDFMANLVRDTLEYREKNMINRNDFLQLLMNLRKQELSGKSFTKEQEFNSDDNVISKMEHVSKNEEVNSIEEQKVFFTESMIAAQAFVFLSAGSESISSTLGFTLYCLSQNPDIQEKAYSEIEAVLERNQAWTYQAIKEMTYLDQVIQETLRMYPVAPFTFRTCTKRYNLPGTRYKMEEGTRVVIPIRAIHNDPENYESPEIFEPHRFINNNFKPSGIYMPFGDGPRICIGMRFAIMELKVVIARILSAYTVKLSSKIKMPLKFKPMPIFLRPEGGFWFKFEKRLTL